MPNMPEPTVGEVWEVFFATGLGHEQQGIRPAIVVSNQGFNETPHQLCIVAPITGSQRGIASQLAIKPPEGGLTKASVIMCEQVRAVSVLRFRRKRGEVNPETLAEVQALVGMFIDRV